jgi:hypothetical protein
MLTCSHVIASMIDLVEVVYQMYVNLDRYFTI